MVIVLIRSMAVSASIIAATCSPAAAADQGPSEPVVVTPGPEYRASWPFRLLFGGPWRDDWTTPLRVPKLDLSTFDGGLSPVRTGGGQQTSSLHLKSANGHAWSFRSVDKDPRRAMDEETRKSQLAEVMRDLTSTAHPTASLVVAPLLEAAGVLHATPELFVMPDDPRLGTFRGEFAGMLGAIEQRPGRGFAGAEKALHTYELFARLDTRTDERLDARAYLRARLMDVFIGDWDRHASQWRWLRFEEGGRRVWRPVPLDRDQAFARFGGAFPSIAEYYIKQFASFGDEYPAIDKLTFSGRYTDRRFLVPLEEADWRDVTSDVVARLTDEAISGAVRHLPPELYARDGATLERALRARREALPAASHAFYRLLAEDVDVYGTVQADVATIRRSRDGGVDLSLCLRDPATGEPLGPPYFRRSFRPGETSEIRLYLLGGADAVVEAGERNDAILVRVVRDDPGAAALAKASIERGTGAAAPPSEEAGDSAPAVPDELHLRYERFRDWGTDHLVFPQLSYDGTRGLFAGARLQRTHFGFGREPFADQMTFAAAWSTGLGEPRLEYQLDLRTQSPFGVLAYVGYSGVDFANFYGFGNATQRDSALASHDFYRVDQHRLVVRPLVTASLLGPLRARAGFGFEHFSNTARSALGPATGAYGSGDMTLGSVEVGAGLDTRTGALTRKRGVHADVSARYYPPWLDNAAGFTKARAEAGAMFGSPVLSSALLSVRAAGEKVWGRHPYFEAASIGGAGLPSPLDLAGGSTGNLLRGYALNRYAGDASIVANADLRIPLGWYSAIVPLRYGLLALGDVGRVFVSGETSRKWHPAAGGGAWLALHAGASGMQLDTTMSFTVVRSDEGTGFYLSSVFGF
ncbi:hypothetical protein AMYX_13210 [Anaeromyxobacter diazotrophicus]|uniref:Bacterial surface antigen (D15) domain-containing protein n=2 Tax=Anaeromyxobacter diazotrophicus TaxID=2590199 RepID=A0A7I9VKA1_9BACT|nr:hypothetical protein AMYX_13210 [Anaeromyxobacter diazotrophicus]